MLERQKSALYQQEMLLENVKITLYQQDMPHQQDMLIERQKSALYQQDILMPSLMIIYGLNTSHALPRYNFEWIIIGAIPHKFNQNRCYSTDIY